MNGGKVLVVLGIYMLQIRSALLRSAIVSDLQLDYPTFFDSRRPVLIDDSKFKIFYQVGKNEDDLPTCAPSNVCNKVDVYDAPWIQRECRCPGKEECSSSLSPDDGHTITDKTRQFKMCEEVRSVPKCRFFRDVTWTYLTYPNNTTQQIVHCVCPDASVAYIVRRKAFHTDGQTGYHYSFACSPQTRLRCQRKEPCRLFTVRKKERHQEVNTSTLCQCPHNHFCPKHHRDPGVIPGKAYAEDGIRTFSGYCM